MNILVITPFFYPIIGGSQNYIKHLYAEVVRSHPQTQVDILTYSFDKKLPYTETIGGLTVYRIPGFQVFENQFALPNIFSLISFLQEIRKQKKYDLINPHTRFFDCSWWAPLLAWKWNAKLLLTDHCAYHPTHSNKFASKLAAAFDRYLVPLLIRPYDLVTTVSPGTQKFVEKFFNKKSVIISCGTHVPKNQTIQKFSNKAITVAFVGRMIKSKGPQLLAAVAQKLTSISPTITFEFAGDGPLLHDLERKYGNSRIIFHGKMAEKQVSDLLSRAQILVHPSTHHEGLPLTLLEAGAHNACVITTRCITDSDLLQDNKTVCICEPIVADIEKKLLNLSLNKNQMKRLALSFHNIVASKYNWPSISKKFTSYLQTQVKLHV